MNHDPNELCAEMKKQQQKLEALLLEALESGKATAFTRADFDEIKKRGMARSKAKRDEQKSA